MERRSILEKLGLIEKFDKVQNEDANDENVDNVIQQVEEKKEEFKEDFKEIVMADKEKPQFTDFIKKPEVQTIVKAQTMDENFDDPIATVKKKKLKKVEEIYKSYNIYTDGVFSLSIVESFQKALPDYLPTDVKRQSILNIIESSNVKVDSLIRDGNDKLNSLKDFSKSFTDESREVISNFEDEINKLNEKINSYKTAIDNMKKLQSEQDFTVKYEIDKINNILSFINPEL